MINLMLSSNPSTEDDVIVWMPFLVKMKHLQLSPSPYSPTPIQQPINVQQIQEVETQALLPPPSANNGKTEKPRKGMASPKQKDFIFKLANKLNMTEAEICQVTGAKSIEQMSNAQANEFITEYKDANPQF